MVGKVKKGEPLYGTSQLSEYLQGVAARNSRYTGLFVHVIPWFNLVNHNQVSYFKVQACVAYSNAIVLARCRYSQVLPAG